MFTDIVGFTAYTEVVGDEKALAVLEAQTERTAAVLEHWPETRVVKELGDGLLIWCGGQDLGFRVAVDLLGALCEERDDDFPLSIRMGMHHGPVTPRGDDFVGHTVNVAARITDLAGPRELVVSEEVVTACVDSADVDLRPVGPTTVKGVSAAIWLYRVAV
jgi:adenylate cyclase